VSPQSFKRLWCNGQHFGLWIQLSAIKSRQKLRQNLMSNII
jgi:hypothetical protein